MSIFCYIYEIHFLMKEECTVPLYANKDTDQYSGNKKIRELKKSCPKPKIRSIQIMIVTQVYDIIIWRYGSTNRVAARYSTVPYNIFISCIKFHFLFQYCKVIVRIVHTYVGIG